MADFSELLKAIASSRGGARAGGINLGGGGSSTIDYWRRAASSSPTLNEPLKAPSTWNLGESLLNLLAIGSAPVAGMGRSVIENLEAVSRAQSGQASLEDQARVQRHRDNPLLMLTDAIGGTVEGYYGGIGDTLAAVTGQGESKDIPTWANNYRRIQDAGVQAGWWEEPNNDPGFLGIGNNDGALAAGGIVTDIVTDPTTYLTLGLSGLVKGAVRGAGSAAARPIAGGAAQAAKFDEAAGGFQALDEAPSLGNTLTEAVRGGARGFKEEVGHFWPAQVAAQSRARKAAREAGVTNFEGGLAPANLGGAASRAVDDEAEAAAVVGERLNPENAAAAARAADLGEGAETAADLAARAASDVIDETADDLLGGVPRQAREPIRAQAAAAWSGALAKSADMFARGTQKALRSITPFNEKPVVTPLSSVGAAGEKDAMGGIVSFWKQVRSGAPLSKPRAALKPQLDDVAKTRIPIAMLDEKYPNLSAVLRDTGIGSYKRSASAQLRTTVDGETVLDLLASGRLTAAVRTLERGGDPVVKSPKGSIEARLNQLLSSRSEGNLELLRAADAEARALVGDLVQRAGSKAMKGATDIPVAVQRAEWKANLVRLLANTVRGVESNPNWVEKTAKELSEITDPAELAERLEAIASSVHTIAHRGPREFFDYIEKIPGREVLNRISAEGIRDFARLIGLPVKGNSLTILKGLRERGYVAYQEAIETERRAAKAFGETSIAGHDLITDGVRAIGNDVTAIKADLMRKADEAFSALDPDDVAAVTASLGAALRRNLSGKAKAAKSTKAGETEIVTPVRLPDGTMSEPKHLIQRVEQQTQYQAFAGLARHFAAKADELGLTGVERGVYMDEKVMQALAAQDAWLRARGMPPTSRMDDAEKTFRLRGKQGLTHKNEVAFLSLRDVLEEIPQRERIALLFSGARASVPPTILHMLGRWAIRRFEAPTTELAERVADYRNAYIQHSWKQMGGRAAFGDSQRFGALADQLLSDADVVARLSEKHVKNAIVARGVWADAAASSSMTVRNAFRKAMASTAAPEGTKIADLLAFSSKIAKALDQSGIDDELVQSMAQLDAAVIAGQTVGPDLFYAARRSDQVRKVEAEHVGAYSDVEVARIAFADGQVADAIARAGKPASTTRMADTPKTHQVREAEAVSGVKVLADAEPDITKLVDEIVTDQLGKGNPMGGADIFALRSEVQFQFGFANRYLQDFFSTFKRGYGAANSAILRTMAQFAPIQATERFNRGLVGIAQKWATPEGAIANPTLVSGFKLLQRIDGPVTLADGTVTTGQRVMADYVDALRAAQTTGAATGAVRTAREALEGVLRQVGGPEAGDDVLEAAVDLWSGIAKVFDSSADGLFARAGNDANDMNAILRSFQRSDGPEGDPLPQYGGFHFTENGTAGDLGHAWKAIGAGGEDIDPIEILRSTHAALQHATIAPTVAASFSREFGHEVFGFSRAEALAKGWQRPYKQSDVAKVPFVKYLDPTQLYDPAMISELKYLDDLLQGVRKPGPMLQKIMERVDPIVQAMKSSITIWRPGHWMTNIMGEAWMNTFAGVTNPARYAESIGLMVRNHRMVKPDMSFFDDYLARNAPEGMMARPLDIDTPNVEIQIGGKLQRVPDDLLYRGMEQRGIVLSHLQADDVVMDVASGALRIGQKKPLQGIRNANRALGRGSIARDSVFRVAHALDVMKKGSFRSVDEALDAAAAAVHKWHPSYQTLTPFDQVYTRRVVYFYTWMRQAIARMFELSLNQPSMAVLPSRVQYAIAYANGLDPQSVGSPVSQDIELPDYLAHSLTGSAVDIDGRVYGMSLNAPTLDIFSQILGPIDVDPTLSAPDNFANSAGNWVQRNVGQMLTPAISIPYTQLTNQTARGENFDPEGGALQRLQNIIDQTGAGYVSKITGQVLPGVPRTDQRPDADEQSERQLLAFINALSGMKWNVQNASNTTATAERDERDRFARWLAQQAAPVE